MSEIRLTHINGALLSAPVYEPHKRGKNWLAVIDVDGSLPGGLSRRFLPRGRGDCLYMIEQLDLFEAIEFGADYTSTYSKTTKKRWYGIVLAVTDIEIVLEQTESGVDACVRSQRSKTNPADLVRAMRESRAVYEAKISELDKEILNITGGAVDA